MAPVERAGVSNLICKHFAFVKACHDFTQTRTPARGFTFLTNGTTHRARAVDAAAAAEEEDASDVPVSLGTRQRAASPARHRQDGHGRATRQRLPHAASPGPKARFTERLQGPRPQGLE
ncbi:unnamed protein product [Lampetra planeri]